MKMDEKGPGKPAMARQGFTAGCLTGLAALGVLGVYLPVWALLTAAGEPGWMVFPAGAIGAGTLWAWRRRGGLKDCTGFKLLWLGTAVLAGAGPLCALCAAGDLAALVPCVLAGGGAELLRQGLARILRCLFWLGRTRRREIAGFGLCLLLWLLPAGLLVWSLWMPWRWLFFGEAAVLPPLCGGLAKALLGRCCLSDQRLGELRRLQNLKEI